ncbi:hypothetical protein BGZ60DRAFT_522299 [Tricladium varicosporioides]|nr:hypothetical protein BGZ60DRAFT_522299 [Hymenoscyphus varicosporioides]
MSYNYGHEQYTPYQEWNIGYPPDPPKEEGSSATLYPRYQTLAPSTPWRTGGFRRFPWLGFLAIAVAILAAIGMGTVLVVSNNAPITDWKISPAVYLAVEAAIANVLLNYALSEGVTVAWWVKAIKPGSTLTDLHHVWSYGTSVKSALLSGRRFNLVALAGLTVALAPLNGPLLQRASTISTMALHRNVRLTIPVAQEFPFGYTGTITGRSHQTGFLTTNFSSVVQDYVLKKPVNLTESGCDGKCTGVLQAAGYAISCQNFVYQFNMSTALAIDRNGKVNTAITNGTNVFSTNFTYYETAILADGQYRPSFNYTSLYKTGSECWGDLNSAQCTLQPALLQYNVLLDNNTISLDPQYTYKDDKVIQYLPAISNNAQGPTTHGGMALALNSMFSSTSHLRFTGAVGYDQTTDGISALQYAVSGLNSGGIYSCPAYWADPTGDMLAATRELAFRTSLHAANITNTTNIQTVQATSVEIVTVYSSHYLYLGLALLFTLLSAICIVPIFMGWWILGRHVSLSPIEIAKAFDAPILANSDSNLGAEDLLVEVGKKQVRYGATANGSGAVYAHNGILVGGSEKLVMGEPQRVHEAIQGRVYTG